MNDDMDDARGMLIGIGWALGIMLLAAVLCWCYITLSPY